MQDILSVSLKKIREKRAKQKRLISILLILSLVVSLDVFWFLRQPGLTLAGNADCGIVEHIHDAECENGESCCSEAEHVHSLDCYADENADVETLLDWQNLFADYPYTGDLQQDLVGLAQTQVGYTESDTNFQIDKNGIRCGYTRYGAWYGTPYNEWSAIFVSFCLHYAGADAERFPGNTGAVAMAENWKKQGNYAPAGQYIPVSGDLAFFSDNTVGIVTQVYGATFSVIRGDIQDAVCSENILLEDASVLGWGQTGNPPPVEETVPETEATIETLPEDPLDVSDGPVVFITTGSQIQRRIQTYSLRRSTPSVTDLIEYLEENGGSYFFTLLDMNNVELQKDENGNYVAEANKNYKLTITFSSPEGFHPGIYEHQISNGLMVNGGDGHFNLPDGSTVGTWEVSDTGQIKLDFNEEINSHTDITVSMTLGVRFPEQDDPIDFDGMITVKVEPPVQQETPTELSKWGSPNADAGKINWTIRIDGHTDSIIPGNILTDQPGVSDWTRPHSYTPSDIANGISFGVSDDKGDWHSWHVSADDPHLVWDETGWSYKIPQTVICDFCGEMELGNDGWIYLVNYTSTPTPLNTPGTFDYENKVTIDGQTAWGWSNFTHGVATAEITKEGAFVSHAGGGAFHWEFQVTIPGRVEGEKAAYSWFVMDEMRLLNAEGTAVGHAQNDAHLSRVIATYNGTSISVPRIQDATDQDMFAWDNAWTATEDGISYNRTLNLLCRCQCTPESCHWTGCGDYWYQKDDGTWAANGFCQCWTETQNMVFTFIYETTDMSLIQSYGALGYQVNNHAQLYNMPNGNSVRISYADATVPIPNLFEKQLTHDFNGYTANYKITINEAKVVLTDGSPLTIRDEMTQTLAYISGSLIITAEDAAGNITTLQQGDDFTVKYDGTGNQTNANGSKVHVLEIVILNPQPVMYTLDYDTTLIMPEQLTGGIKYSNSAEITLWGDSIKDDSQEKVHAEINIATKSYKVRLYKVSAETGEALGGAVFGLFNEQGGLITTGTTDVNGELLFQTNITKGIVLREHILYYVQELNPPPGYQLDDTKYWICFCDKAGTYCGEFTGMQTEHENVIRIPLEQTGRISIANKLMEYSLPETGGPGIYPIILVSVMFIIIPLVYLSIQRRKQERRGVG